MALGTEFPIISTGNLYTAIDTYASSVSTQPPINSPSWPNGALNPAGAAYLLAPGAGQSANLGAAANYGANGAGAPLIVRYVRYHSTANPNLLAYPAPVYWVDETYTTVTGVFSESLGAGNPNALAGWLLPNYTALGLTAAAAAAALNGNWCFIATKGFVPAAAVVALTAIGDALVGATGNFTVARVASGTAPTSRYVAIAQSAVTGNVTSDINIFTDLTY